MNTTRRSFCQCLATAAAMSFGSRALFAAASGFRLRYIVGSSLYGTLKLEEILPDVRKTGAEHIDIWPLKHGDQREQVEAMGHEAFAALLKKHGVKLGCITRYDLGPLKLQDEMRFAKKFGCQLIITGAVGPKDATGDALKAEVKKFVELMKPHVAVAEENGVTIGIENHGNALIDSPDSIRWLAEFSPSPRLAVALAPYHLPQDAQALAKLVEDIAPRLAMFYAWEHGHGCMKPMPKAEELLQMPGRGTLDFTPMLAALKKINYTGWTEPFMHPTPRGIPILDTATEVTAEINRARAHLEACLQKA